MKQTTTAAILIALLIILLVPTYSHAIFFWGTKSLGMGTASVGIADDNNAMEINPAGIAQGNRYAIDLNYERREYEIVDYPHLHRGELVDEEDSDPFGGEFFADEEPAIDPDEKEVIDAWRISVVDSKTVSSFAMGLYVTGMNLTSQSYQEGLGYNAGICLAGSFADIVFIGGNAKYIQRDEDMNMFNADFGLLIHPIPFLGLGLAGHNVIQADVPRRVNRDLTFGIAGYVLEYAQIDFDVTKDFDSEAANTWNFAFGAQGIVLKGLTLRGGFYWNLVDEANLYGLGLGWTDKEFGALGLTFQGDVDNTRNYIISANFSAYF